MNKHTMTKESTKPLPAWLDAITRPAVWISLAAVIGAMLIGLALIASLGVPVKDAVEAFAEGAWGSPYACAASINRSLVFALVGLGFVLAQRANLTNVGGEGQIAIGGIVATAVSLYGGVSAWPFNPKKALARSDA